MSFFKVEPTTSPLLGTARIPGDKSVGHRSLLFGALADGPVTIQGLSGGKDNQRSRHAMAAMGVRIEDLPTGQVRVHGVGVDGLQAPERTIDCGNSGTTMRLLAGLLAAQPFDSILAGDDSLSVRPMRRVADPLMEMGAKISGPSGKVADEMYPPLQITGLTQQRLHGIRYEQPVASAQVKSALLLAGLFADSATEVIEPGQSRDHTELMLAKMGAPIVVDGNRIRIDPVGWDRKLGASEIQVPGDPSSAAFLIAAALVGGVERMSVNHVCVNRRRTGFLDVLSNLGALVEQESRSEGAGDPVADLVVSHGAADRLAGTVISGDLTVRSLDELPILAVVAARATGTTDFQDAKELRFKESDRIATTCSMLRKLGVEVDERPDGFSVEGLAGAPFQACEIDAHGDHRIAMSAVIAGLGADGPVRVNDVDNVATSFPTFVTTLTELGATLSQSS
jgi:3-phosphoshikimate 1-carboxyvinyltransferase